MAPYWAEAVAARARARREKCILEVLWRLVCSVIGDEGDCGIRLCCRG